MMTFRANLANLTLPLGTAWLLTDIAEAKGRQDLHAQRPPTVLKRAYRELEKAANAAEA